MAGVKMEDLLLHLLVFSCLLSSSIAELTAGVGVNYGRLGNNLPPPRRAAELIKKTIKAHRIKIYDANPDVLRALSVTHLEVSMQVANELIDPIAVNQTFSDEWVRHNVAPFYPATRIRYLLVGNEVLSNTDLVATWPNLVPAMSNIHSSLQNQSIKVKVVTSLAIDVLESSLVFPPSNASFRSDISGSIIKPMLEFLRHTGSVVFLDVYPYFHWVKDPKGINLDYVLFQGNGTKHEDSGSGLVYTNFFDQMVDSVYFAMDKLGYHELRVFIGETGWPNSGDFDQIGANIYNAATYNRNIVKRLTTKPPIGTPARPGHPLPGLIFGLFNENQKSGPATERHFGLMYPRKNGTLVYEIDLSGETPDSSYGPLPEPSNNEPYKGDIWCVVAMGAKWSELEKALETICAQGNNTCDEIQPNGSCYKPDSVMVHASYVFSSYWARVREIGVSCFFNGLATQTIKDPSYGSCKFPSVTL